MKKIIMCIIIIIIACCGVYAIQYQSTTPTDPYIPDLSDLEVQDNITVNENITVEKQLFNTNESDTNTILVENNSTIEIVNSAVNKTGDSTDNGDNTDFYGTNSALLVKKGSTAKLNNVEIETNSTGSNALFVTNSQPNSNKEQPTDINNEPNNMQPQNDGGQPQEMPQGNNNQNGQPPEKPDSDNQPNQMSNMNMEQQSENMNNQEDYSEGGANAVIDNVKINTYKDKSRGLDATYGGKITANNVIINTRANSCAALATDRGEGTLIVENSQLNTGVDNGTGRGSPCIYSTGNITVKDSTGTAYVSQMACIEGKNSITLFDCELNCFGEGNREENGNYVDLGGIFIYQSMSGDANIGTATFNATDSQLSIDQSSKYYNEAPMFHVTNTNAIINIEGCDLTFGSGILLDVSGQNQWGNTGSNGGNLEFNTNDEKLDGNICIDEISSLNFTMNNTQYTGSINQNDSYGQTNIIIDSSSTWTLTGDSHITSLENNGNINYGNYTLFIDGEAYTSSNPYNK